MIYGIAILSIVPLRNNPTEQSEMLSQVLFGESFEVLNSKKGWLLIRLDYDFYEGWIDSKHCEVITKFHYNNLNKNKKFVSPDLCNSISSKTHGNALIVAGSTIPKYKGKFSFKLFRTNYKFLKRPEKTNHDDLRTAIVYHATKYLNSPYLWGGRTPFGIDCSGFAQIVYKICGVCIPRDASQQVDVGTAVNFVNEAKPGDLAFFDNEEGNITHVGIILGNSRIIHASGVVRIDYIDHEGINNKDTLRYTHQLRVIKNLLEPLSEYNPKADLGIQQELF